MLRAVLMGVLVVALLGGCPASESSLCRNICQRMTACVDALDQTELVIDENECTATCTQLERDTEGKEHVEKHAACVQGADGCENVLACF